MMLSYAMEFSFELQLPEELMMMRYELLKLFNNWIQMRICATNKHRCTDSRYNRLRITIFSTGFAKSDSSVLTKHFTMGKLNYSTLSVFVNVCMGRMRIWTMCKMSSGVLPPKMVIEERTRGKTCWKISKIITFQKKFKNQISAINLWEELISDL